MELSYQENYKHNDLLRKGLNDLGARTFGLGLEEFYQRGWWNEKYVPHSYVDGGTIAANISTNQVELLWKGQELSACQIGTVMTDPAYRKQGLSRKLMERILTEYRPKCDFLYLFANKTVLDFYPKFGFVPVTEHTVILPLPQPLPKAPSLRKLDARNAADRETTVRLSGNAVPVSPLLSVRNNQSLSMFYLDVTCPELAWYAEEIDALLVLERCGDTLYLQDILSERPFSLLEAVAAAAGEPRLSDGAVRIAFGFTPDEGALRQAGLQTCAQVHDDHLFMLPPVFSEERFHFPFLSRA